MTIQRSTGVGATVLRYEFYGDKIDLADEIKAEFVLDAKAAINEASAMLLGEVHRLLQLRQGTPETVAPEGQPPERDQGELLRSWKRIPARLSRSFEGAPQVVGGIKSNNAYAVRLEYGLTDKLGRRILPHPYVRPAMATMDGPIGALLAERLG